MSRWTTTEEIHMRKLVGAALAAAAMMVVVVGVVPASATPVAHSAKKCNKAKRKRLHKRPCPKVKSVLVPVPGPAGPPGQPGQPGDPGGPGTPGTSPVTSLPSRGFSATNSTVVMTPDGVHFGPYADGGNDGGSICFDGLDGQHLSAVLSLVYTARYTAENDTGGVGVPYLRIFLVGGHSAIFSPNTQKPNPDIAQGPFHTWVATSGSWRYDDDPGNGPDESYSQLQADHGGDTIDVGGSVCITEGFTNGQNLDALLRQWKIKGGSVDETFAFGS